MLNQCIVEIGGYILDLDVHPCADLDGSFRAFCREEKEYLNVNGWLADSIHIVQDDGEPQGNLDDPVYNCIRGGLA